MLQAMASLNEYRVGNRGLCHREYLLFLAARAIERFREFKRELLAVAQEFCRSDNETHPSGVQPLEQEIFGPSGGADLLSHVLLIVDTTFRRPSLLIFARNVLAAALDARNAATEGDSETVDAFSMNVLGLRSPGRWREAVEMALLGDWVELLGTFTATDDRIMNLIQQHADAQHCHLQPLWERRARGKRTVLLGQRVDETRTLGDLLVEHRTPEQELLSRELSDDRIVSVLKAMRSEEQAIALAWAAHCDTWAETAKELSHEQRFGERVRRKLKRLGDRHTTRAAEAARSAQRPW